MRWVLAFHIIFVVCWFAGLLYLPRLYVYQAMATDAIGLARFNIMTRKLFWGIMTPAGVLASLLGLVLLAHHWAYYRTQHWMDAKLALVVLLWAYHGLCWHYLRCFKQGRNPHTHVFYRWFNEIGTVFLVAIVILVVVRPSF